MIDSFVTVTDDIKQIIHILDNPRLVDKYGNIAFFAVQLKGCAKELSENRYLDNQEIIKIEQEIDDIMNYINEFWDLLLKEVDHKLT